MKKVFSFLVGTAQKVKEHRSTNYVPACTGIVRVFKECMFMHQLLAHEHASFVTYALHAELNL